jgi:general secretion pathway protein D
MNRWIVAPWQQVRGPEKSVVRKMATRAVTVLLLALLVIMPATSSSPDKAKSLFAQGTEQESLEHFDQAYQLYKQAFDLKPKDVQFRAAYERLKYKAAAQHVHTGQLLREAGKLAEALAEFESAMRIDPSNFMAVQEARRTKELIDQASNPDLQPKMTGLSERLRSAGSPVELAPISNQPITLRMSEDSKVVYETIGKLAGINVLFDPDYTSRRVRIDLNSVSLGEALEIVSMQSKTFWRPVTSNTIYVAADTTAKRKEIEQQVLRTFYLSNLSSTTELQDVTNTLRTVLELQRLQQLPSQNAIVVRGTPDQVALAEKLINDLDKARPEVMVEVAVMQVSRDKLRMLGIQWPFRSDANPTISFQSPSSSTSSTTLSNGTQSATGTNTTSTGNLTLNDFANLDARNFAVSIPPASIAFLLNDSNTKVIQNPQIRALDGQKATLKIGQRIPVATGSFQSGIGGGVGINPLVNTQFQYIDVGVNVDVTPHVFQNRDVDMKVMLEISAVDRFDLIGGIRQPVIGQRKVEHEIRLKEGEVNLIGGMLEDSETKSMNGLPWLSQIPVLRYLFGQSTTERINNEIVFVLVPHVVRGTDVLDQNLRILDVGTQNQIGLRRATTLQGGGARPQGAPPAQPPVQPAPAPANPSSTQSPSTQSPTSSNAPVLSFDPPTIAAATNQTFSVNVTLVGGQNIFSVPAQISYDPKLMQLVSVSNGGALSQDGQSVALVHRENQEAGTVQVTATRPPGSTGVAVNGSVFTLTFQAKAPGQGTLSINRALLRDATMASMPAGGSQAVITVR